MSEESGKNRCPCKGQYVSPSMGKCSGWYPISYGRRSWMPGCLEHETKKVKRKKFYKYCSKYRGGCGRTFTTRDEDQELCRKCESWNKKQNARDQLALGNTNVHWLVILCFLGFLVGMMIVFLYQASIFLECV